MSICEIGNNIRKEPANFMTDKLENEVLEEIVPEEAVEEKPKKRGRKKKVVEEEAPTAAENNAEEVNEKLERSWRNCGRKPERPDLCPQRTSTRSVNWA